MASLKSKGDSLADWLAAEPFTLAMSSGFFGFFAHAGVLCALDEAGLKPVRARGSSAGALVTGLWAAGLEAKDIARELLALSKADFWDPRPGFGLLAGSLFDQKLRQLLPVQRFEDCRVPMAVSVYDVFGRKTRIVERGDLASHLRASCAVPFLFQPVWIGRRPLLDGGIADRSSLGFHPEGERTLYHHLMSNSFWRRPNSKGVQIPERPNLRTWIVPDLPRVTPNRLELGAAALAKAREQTRLALAAKRNR